MKEYFIPVEFKMNVNIKEIERIAGKKKITLCSPIQYINVLREVERKLKKNGIKVVLNKCITTGVYGQVLGCDASACKEGDIVFYIGDGRFHPIWIKYKTRKKVYVVNESGIKEIDNREVEKMEKYVEYTKLKFYEAKKVGIIVSLKPGQNRLKLAKELKKKIKDKDVFIFLTDNIDPNELNDFNVDIWINTACPRIIDERKKFFKPIVNVGEMDETWTAFFKG